MLLLALFLFVVCCCLLLPVWIPDSDKNVSLWPPYAPPTFPWMACLVSGLCDVCVMLKRWPGKQGGFGMNICPKVKGSLVCMNWLTREAASGAPGASGATKCDCQTTLFVRSGIHEIFMQAKNPALQCCQSGGAAATAAQKNISRPWNRHRGASGFIGLPGWVDENWRVQCSQQLLQSMTAIGIPECQN